MRLLLLASLLAACRTTPVGAGNPLAGVGSWTIQLQGLEREGATERLERADVDLVVLEATRTVRGEEAYPTRDVVARLRGRGRICLAYVNVGQAEGYRTYWRPHWRAPTAERRGDPSYLLTVDREGWEENYPVCFWDLRWRTVLWGSSRAPVDQALADGFDGLYLDWVLGARDPAVVAAAREAGVDPVSAMAELVKELRLYARRRRPGFLIVAQNIAALPEVAPYVDGAAQEHLTFTGKAGAKWDDAAAGDIPVADTERVAQQLRDLGVPVFTIDYAAQPAHAQRARSVSRGYGFVPAVSRTPLDRLPSELELRSVSTRAPRASR